MSIFGTPVFSSAAGWSSGSLSSSSLNTNVGDLIVAYVSGNAITPPFSVQDTADSIAYTPLTLRVSSVDGRDGQWFYHIATKANAANTVTVTFTTPYAIDGLLVWDVPITGGTPAYDVDTDFQVNAAYTNPVLSPSFSTVGTDEIVFAAMDDSSRGGGGSWTQGSGYTLGGVTSPYGENAGEHQIFSSPQTGITASFVGSSYGQVDVTAVAFKLQETCSTPSFSPNSCNQGPSCTVTATSTTGSTIWYTTDGTTPTVGGGGTTSSVASGSTISISSTTTAVKGVAAKTNYSNSSEGDSGTYTINGAVATCTFSPVAGAYDPAQTVSIINTNHTLSGFQIYYTTNGDTPDNTKFAYTYGTTIPISASCTLKAIAYATNYSNSAVTSAAYTITYTISGNVGLTGSLATSTSVGWTGNNSTSGSVTPASDGSYSITGLLSTVTYTITPVKGTYSFTPAYHEETISAADVTGDNFSATYLQVATTTFSPVAGTYTSAQTVTFNNTNSSLSGFHMYWNTTGSPTTGSTLYTGPITVSATETVYVLAVATGYANSAVGSAAYTIGLAPAPTIAQYIHPMHQLAQV
jgi:hypothetical protein